MVKEKKFESRLEKLVKETPRKLEEHLVQATSLSLSSTPLIYLNELATLGSDDAFESRAKTIALGYCGLYRAYIWWLGKGREIAQERLGVDTENSKLKETLVDGTSSLLFNIPGIAALYSTLPGDSPWWSVPLTAGVAFASGPINRKYLGAFTNVYNGIREEVINTLDTTREVIFNNRKLSNQRVI